MRVLYSLIFSFLTIDCYNLISINKRTKLSINHKYRHTSPLLSLNNQDANFSNVPSFYDFIKQRNITFNAEENKLENYVENFITNYVNNYELIHGYEDPTIEYNENNQDNQDNQDNNTNYSNTQTEINNNLATYTFYMNYIKEPTSKDLKLLTPEACVEWAKTWTFEMTHIPSQFPTFMFQDMFKMRDFGTINCSRNYFYIGFFPKKVDLKYGPYFIGAFELRPVKREFITHAIIQNPYYYSSNFDKTKFVAFKKELLALCRDASVFLKFSNLKNTKNERYYFSWLYDNI